ncbi:MAG: peptidyl-prolyl cis-trans isomerase [Candidatus Kapaibacteriales bacterium]
MGTFERIRQLSPWALGVFAFTFIAFMVLGDVSGTNTGGGELDPVIAIIDGEEVTVSQYDALINEATATQQRSNPGAEVDNSTMRMTAWSQLTDNTIHRQQANSLGYFINKVEGEGKELLAEEILENPPQFLKQGFIDSTGTFNESAYRDALTNYERNIQSQMQQVADNPDMPDQQKQQIIDQLRNQFINIETQLLSVDNIVLQQTFQNSVREMVNTAAGVVSNSYAKRKYILDNTKVSFDLAVFPLTSISEEEAVPTDEEIRDHYNKNKEYYKQYKTAQVKYSIFPIKPSKKDFENNQKNVDEFKRRLDMAENDSLKKVIFKSQSPNNVGYTLVKDIMPGAQEVLAGAEKGQIVGPVPQANGTLFYMVNDKREGENTVVKASHILLNFGDNKDSVYKEAVSLKQTLNSSNFAQFARERSADKGSAVNGGDLGYFDKGRMVPEFEEAAFGASEGSIVGPIETQFGYHIIYVENKTSEEIDYSSVLFSPKVSESTRGMIIAEAQSFRNQVESGTDMDTLAAKLGVQVESTGDITTSRRLLGRQSITNEVFDSPAGFVSKVKKIEGQGYLVFKVIDKKEEGIATLESVEAQVKSEATKVKKQRLALEKAEKALAAVKNGNLSNINQIDKSASFQNVSNIDMNASIPGAGNDYVLRGAVLNAEAGKVSGLIVGTEGVYLIKVTSKTEPSEEQIASNLKEYKANLKQRESNVYFQWLSDFKQKVDIEDKRLTRYDNF